MPVRGEEVKITNEDLENRLGHAPVRNERQPAPVQKLENQRILTYISQSSDAEELNRIGKAAAKRLRDIGAARPQQKKPEKKAKLTDRALLHLYLNFSPFLLALAIMLPLALWLGNIAPMFPWFYVFGSKALTLHQACPPNCTSAHLVMWAAIGGISLLLSFLVSYVLRKRLLKAI